MSDNNIDTVFDLAYSRPKNFRSQIIDKVGEMMEDRCNVLLNSYKGVLAQTYFNTSEE